MILAILSQAKCSEPFTFKVKFKVKKLKESKRSSKGKNLGVWRSPKVQLQSRLLPLYISIHQMVWSVTRLRKDGSRSGIEQ